MPETRAQAYYTAAALLRNMGYSAHVREGWVPPGGGRPVTALVTCAPALVLGMVIGLTAEDPEAHLPDSSAKVPRHAPGKAGDPQHVFWFDNK